MMGFKIIGEMTREELVDEIMHFQRRIMEEQDTADLKSLIIDFRLAETRKRLEKEAGIKITQGLLGRTIQEDDDNG